MLTLAIRFDFSAPHKLFYKLQREEFFCEVQGKVYSPRADCVLGVIILL